MRFHFDWPCAPPQSVLLRPLALARVVTDAFGLIGAALVRTCEICDND